MFSMILAGMILVGLFARLLWLMSQQEVQGTLATPNFLSEVLQSLFVFLLVFETLCDDYRRFVVFFDNKIQRKPTVQRLEKQIPPTNTKQTLVRQKKILEQAFLRYLLVFDTLYVRYTTVYSYLKQPTQLVTNYQKTRNYPSVFSNSPVTKYLISGSGIQAQLVNFQQH